MNTNHQPHDCWNPEWLAGYADGELNSADRAKVEQWLIAHPEQRLELESQNLLARNNREFWNKVEPPAVAEANWSMVCNKVAARLEPARPAYREPAPSTWKRWAMAFSAMAMTGLLALSLPWRLDRTPNGGTGLVAVTEDSLPVARADEVDIISIQGDAAMVLIGNSLDALEMTTYGDVIVESIISDENGQPTKANLAAPGGDPNRPIWAPTEKTHPVP